jgi:LysM repeat protein
MMHVLIIAGASLFHPQVLQDSIGTEVINGKVFVVHMVAEKETLYGISKRYGTTVDIILQYNPTADAGLEIGQVLKVPYVARQQQSAGGGIVHTVAAKETMFSISQAYNVSIDEIRQWNNLTDNSLAIGQELTIKRTGTKNDKTPVSSSRSTHRKH